MKKEKLIKIVNNFKGKKIGVIGDLMLDQFVWGDVERISPEAPIPVVLINKETYALGGAANTANNVVASGGNVFLVGIIGEDVAGKKLFHRLQMNNINTKGVVVLPDKPTTQKTRIIAGTQQIVRVDKEKTNYLNKQVEQKVINFINSYLKEWDALVITDYGKGFITESLISKVKELTQKYYRPIIGDIKPAAHIPYFKNITLLTPNQKEASEISGTKDVTIMGKIIQKQLKCNVLITRGADGMTLFENNKNIHFPTKAKEVFDVVGAGDTIAALISLSLASGANLKEAAVIANHAAGIVVGKIGTATVSPEELINDLKNNYE